MRTLTDTLAILRRVAATGTGLCALIIVGIVLTAAAFAPVVATHDPDALDVMNRFAGLSWAHWLGTDHLGRDMYSRLVFGARIAMAVALFAIGIALSIGTLLGIIAAYLPARSERVILVLFDIIAAFPSLILALAFVAVFGPSTQMVVIIVAITLIPHFGRVARAQVLSVKSAPYLVAEQILGASPPRIILHHVLPNIASPLAVLASMDVPIVITIEAGLSFLGLGVRPPLASWGTLIQDGYQFLSDSAIPVTVATVALAVTTLGFTLLGEALRDAVDPRLQRYG